MANRDGGREWAHTVGLQALAFVAGSEALLVRFLAMTGVEADELRHRIDDPELLGAVLDFLLGHETDLHAFCAACDLAPETPAAARRAFFSDQ